MYHHWLELISKYESLSSEKIASSIKITLARQNVRGPLANALSLSITEKSTWNDIHNLLVNYFNNSIPSDTKEIYQFDISGKVSKEDSVNQVGKKGKGKSKKSKGQSKGKGPSQNQNQKGKGKSKGQSKGKTKSKGKGQWTTWSGQSWSWNQNQGQGGKGKGKGHQVCSHCGRKGHSVDQCWWAQKTQLSLGITLSQSCPQISCSEDFKISDLFINNNLTISHTSHNHLHRQWCPQSLPLAKVKDSVVISSESTTLHQVSQRTTSWRSTSPTPSMILVLHCLKNVKTLGSSH